MSQVTVGREAVRKTIGFGNRVEHVRHRQAEARAVRDAVRRRELAEGGLIELGQARQPGSWSAGSPGVENVISVIALMLRLPYRNGMISRSGAPWCGEMGSSFISQASST